MNSRMLEAYRLVCSALLAEKHHLDGNTLYGIIVNFEGRTGSEAKICAAVDHVQVDRAGVVCKA